MNEDFYNKLRTWLFQQLEWYTVQMAQSGDKDGHNMHTFYHGHVSMLEETIRTIHTLKAKELKSEDK